MVISDMLTVLCIFGIYSLDLLMWVACRESFGFHECCLSLCEWVPLLYLYVKINRYFSVTETVPESWANRWITSIANPFSSILQWRKFFVFNGLIISKFVFFNVLLIYFADQFHRCGLWHVNWGTCMQFFETPKQRSFFYEKKWAGGGGLGVLRPRPPFLSPVFSTVLHCFDTFGQFMELK